MYAEITIKPAHGGFGLYQADRDNSPEIWEDYPDLLAAMEEESDGSLYEIGVDELPPGAEDIRGKIEKGEPDRVFAVVQGGAVRYTGIERKAYAGK